MSDVSPLERIAALEAARDQWKDRAERLEATLRNVSQAAILASMAEDFDPDLRAALRRSFRDQLTAHGFTLDDATGAIQ